jgi:hypothetical protein
MAYYQILSWGGIPSQLKVWDDADEIKLEMPPRFMARIDATAQAKGLTSTDDYLGQWSWGEEQERDGTASEVAAILVSELERQFPPGQ